MSDETSPSPDITALLQAWSAGNPNALDELMPVVYAELPGAQHTFDLFHSLRFESVVDGIEAFAAWVRSRRAPGL